MFAIDLSWACRAWESPTSVMPLVMASNSIVVTCDRRGGSLNDPVIVRILTDRGIEVERMRCALALLIEEQDAQRGERLRHRTDVEPGVGLDGTPCHVGEAIPFARATCPSLDNRHGYAGDLVLRK